MSIRRRDLLGLGAATALYAVVRPRVALAGNDQTVLAVAMAMVGPTGRAAWEAGAWDVVRDVDNLLSQLAPDQERLVRIGFRLLETWPKGPRRFSRLDLEGQQDHLDAWRTSDNELQRSVWGVLHAATVSSFSSGPQGWGLMDYPGPNVGTTRPVGQTVSFEWDEVVP